MYRPVETVLCQSLRSVIPRERKQVGCTVGSYRDCCHRREWDRANQGERKQVGRHQVGYHQLGVAATRVLPSNDCHRGCRMGKASKWDVHQMASCRIPSTGVPCGERKQVGRHRARGIVVPCLLSSRRVTDGGSVGSAIEGVHLSRLSEGSVSRWGAYCSTWSLVIEGNVVEESVIARLLSSNKATSTDGSVDSVIK